MYLVSKGLEDKELISGKEGRKRGRGLLIEERNEGILKVNLRT